MLVVIHLADAVEQSLVERNLVLQVGEHGHHLLLDVAQLGGLVGLGQREEHTAHAVEQPSALLIGHDGILEGGSLLAAHDGGNIFALLLHGSLEGGQVVGRLYFAEVGRAEGQLALLQQRVVLLLCVLTGR